MSNPLMHLDRKAFLSAGFLVTKRFQRPAYASSRLLPDYLLSASSCLGTFIPDTWCIDWTGESRELRGEKAKSFGLTDEALQGLMKFVTSRFEKSFFWPNVCASLDAARNIVKSFLPDRTDIVVLELALAQACVKEFCQAAEPQPPKEGVSPQGRQGVYEMILKGRPVLETGIPLGFEPLVFNMGLSCSWLCNGLEVTVNRDLGIAPNPLGLISTLSEALQCVAHISQDHVNAEPGLWLPWLLVDHTQEPVEAP